MKMVQLKESFTIANTEQERTTIKAGFTERYLEYCCAQEKEKIYWYMKAIIIIPCVIMVPTIFLMRAATENYIWFVGLEMVLFFANVMVHIAGAKSKLFVPVYHFSILAMILIPAIFYLISQ